ncbi:HAMP domain-containing histidine kinase [Paraburkholderia sp. LEh10]|uniref:sensor histidine kinase n=1 Tax=Paraburkholderia sp. LEh10 TaxID=2821353 RepID=UPI001AE59A32|nr:HAMP domain-containing sensor histidine kinase [Paraburkholderia sp. LEh10]MBP0592091.1 HAMP domain-containing histidine kinase [Paraburkholderia sp. LEh10]
MSIVTTSNPSSSGSNEGMHAVTERTARRCAEAALFMRDHVLSLVSHDLRSPLNAIHSWAYVLERKIDATDATAQRALEGIRNGVDQQVKLLESIVDTTRAETRTLVLESAPFALRPLLDETIGDAREALAARRDVTIEPRSSLDSQQLDGDRERLAAALWLLVIFAVEASASGATVTVDASVDASMFQTTVTYRPSPAALTDPALPHVLENFARAQATHAREASRISWVLGLCKRVAEAHDGAFEQGEWADGQPATLRLRVPLSGA